MSKKSNLITGAEEIRICTELILPPRLAGKGIDAAINENPDNVITGSMMSGVARAAASASEHHIPRPTIALFTTKLWRPGRTLKVKFMDKPSTKVRRMIEKYAHEWEKYANIKFNFGNYTKADIRITCKKGIGSWSYLGTDALVIPKSRATMNFGWFTDTTPEEEFSRTVLHEFGHALAAIHEHQHPDGVIPWNKKLVYQYYKTTQGWDKDEVDDQIFDRYSRSQLNTSKYDRKSIMHYPIDPKLLTQPSFAVGWNKVLSARDKSFIKAMYP